MDKDLQLNFRYGVADFRDFRQRQFPGGDYPGKADAVVQAGRFRVCAVCLGGEMELHIRKVTANHLDQADIGDNQSVYREVGQPFQYLRQPFQVFLLGEEIQRRIESARSVIGLLESVQGFNRCFIIGFRGRDDGIRRTAKGELPDSDLGRVGSIAVGDTQFFKVPRRRKEFHQEMISGDESGCKADRSAAASNFERFL